MGMRGPKPVSGLREPNGRISRKNAEVHRRADVPYAGWNVYFATAGGFTKVGFSGNVRKRMYEIGHGVGAKLRILGTISLSSESECRQVEKDLHKILKSKGYHYDGEWFDMSDSDVLRELRALVEQGRVVSGISNKPRINLINDAFLDAEDKRPAWKIWLAS
jgi:hypothetical protein